MLRVFSVLVLMLMAAASSTQAQQFPDRPVHVLVGYAAGSGPDIQARTVAQQLSIKLGQQFYVENRLGANGTIAARSVALTAFGVDSGIELSTALVVLRQLLLHTERATDEELDARERQASRLVGWGLYGLIVYIVASSGWSLLTQSRPESSTPGLLLAVAALLVMPVLWRWRRRLAEALDSPALRGDAACSLVCTYMAATLLAGLLLNRFLGWWWAAGESNP